MKTMMLRMIQGSQGRRNADFGLAIADCDFISLASFFGSSSFEIAALRQTFFGFQNLRNVPNAAIETNAATTSTNHGPWKFETRNCGTANATAATRIAG